MAITKQDMTQLANKIRDDIHAIAERGKLTDYCTILYTVSC